MGGLKLGDQVKVFSPPHFAGLYCGPLRLLAWEIAKRLNRAKVPCDLITGQEREEIDGAKHKAVTVEMADVSSNYQCAVIDEVQVSQLFILIDIS